MIAFFRLLLVGALWIGGYPAAAAEPVVPPPITKKHVCPVCRMFPANYPKWHAQIIFKDGGQVAFESPADMFRFMAQVTKYDVKHTQADIARRYVADYEKRDWLDAQRAFFVQGASVRGPMGNDLPAFGTKQAATAFAGKSGGRVLRFDQVTPAVIQSLTEDE